jgi:hypothetical protein
VARVNSKKGDLDLDIITAAPRRMMSNRHACCIALLAGLLGSAGCSPVFSRPATLPATAATPQAVHPAENAGPFLYVGGLKLSMYALGSSEPLRSVKVNNYISKAELALDLHGHLCLANGDISAAQILAYDARTLKFVGGVNGQGAFPALLADRRGYLYASTNGAGIYVYAPGCTRGVNVIRRGANYVGPLVFDRSGNLYAGIQPHFAVSVYAPAKRPGHMRYVRQIRNGIGGDPFALATGPSGDLFVANWRCSMCSDRYYVTVYQPGGSRPVLKITKGIKVPLALAVDSKGWLYVANNPPAYGGGGGPFGWISVYAPGGSQPVRKVKVRDPIALALDPSDNLYVANLVNHSSVLVYSAAGAAKLLLTIKVGVDQPTALLIGSP